MSKKTNYRQQDFLLTFFDKEPKYQEQEVNGFWLIKQYNRNTGDWQVGIFTKESYENYLNLIRVKSKKIRRKL